MDLNNPLIYFINFIIIIVIGFFLGRFLRGRGKIRCTISELGIEFQKYGDRYIEYKRCNYKEAERGSYNIELDFFNEKDVQIALRNPSVIFERKNKKKVITIIKPVTNYFSIAKGFNLPSRKLFHCSWLGSISGQFSGLENVMKSNKAFFVGYLPNGKKVKILILKEPLYSLLKDYYRESIKIEK